MRASLSKDPGDAMNWFATPIGQRLLVEEQREAIPLLTQHIGVRGLYLRPVQSAPAVLSGNMLQSVFNLYQQGGRVAGEISADADALPLESDSMCLVYALHTLDCCASPRPLLDELRRVLRPEGVLILLGLSSLSGWRLRWMNRGLRARSPWRARSLLGDAGFGVELQTGLGSRLPWLGPQAGSVLHDPVEASPLDALRAAYVLVARKRRIPLTPMGQRQRAPVGALQPQAQARTQARAG